MPAFQATGSSKPSEDSLPQPPYIVLDAAPIHGVPIEDLALRSVHLTVSNLPIGSGISSQLPLTGSPDPRQLPFGPGSTPVSDQLCGNPSAERPIRGFPVSCRLSTVGVRFLGPPAPAGELRLPHGRPTGHHAGPQRGCHVAHEQDSTGQGAPFTPGTVVRSRPANVLRPAPAAFQRPVPTAPLTHPIGGGHLHEASSGVHSRSPITPRWLAATPEPESESASRRSSPRPRPPDGTAAASASTPGFAPRGHPQSTPGRRQALRALARVLHLRHQPNLQPVPPTSLMHPHVARSRWWLPSPRT